MDHGLEAEALAGDGCLERAGTAARQGDMLSLEGVEQAEDCVRPGGGTRKLPAEGGELLQDLQLVTGAADVSGVIGGAPLRGSGGPAACEGDQVVQGVHNGTREAGDRG